MCSYDDEIEAFFLKHFGTISEDGLDEKFQKYDKDGNGFIEKKELDELIKDISDEKLSADSLKEFKVVLLNKLDKNGDGKLDKGELRALLPTQTNFLKQFCHHGKKICGVDFFKIWNHYDVNSNGSLEGTELDNFLRDLYLKSKSTASAKLSDEDLDKEVKLLHYSLLEKFNKTNDGSLSRHDLFDFLQVDALSPSFQGKSNEEFEKIFANHDKDKNGSIEGTELAKLLADLCRLDGDGITEEDMSEYSNIVLSKLDKNKDKKIDKSELKDFLKIQD